MLLKNKRDRPEVKETETGAQGYSKFSAKENKSSEEHGEPVCGLCSAGLPTQLKGRAVITHLRQKPDISWKTGKEAHLPQKNKIPADNVGM